MNHFTEQIRLVFRRQPLSFLQENTVVFFSSMVVAIGIFSSVYLLQQCYFDCNRCVLSSITYTPYPAPSNKAGNVFDTQLTTIKDNPVFHFTNRSCLVQVHQPYTQFSLHYKYLRINRLEEEYRLPMLFLHLYEQPI